jgi:hypothetical protein
MERLGAALVKELAVAESAVDGCAVIYPAFVQATGAEGADIPLCGARDTSTQLLDIVHLAVYRVVGAKEREHNVCTWMRSAGREWGMGARGDRRGWDVAAGDERALYLALEATERV